MLAFERRSEILNIMKSHNNISVSELAKKFFVCESTIRRDLAKISKNGSIRRTYGGAVLLDNRTSDLPILLREKENADTKDIIAKLAVGFIKDGDTIMLDASSTVMALVPLLSNFKGLTVITNGIKTAYLLNAYGQITTYCTGGRLREHNTALVGATTCQRISEINVDILFISCRGVSAEKGVTEASEEEAQVKKAMIASAQKTILLCDSTKIGKVLMNRVCKVEQLNTIITEQASEQFISDITSYGIRIITKK